MQEDTPSNSEENVKAQRTERATPVCDSTERSKEVDQLPENISKPHEDTPDDVLLASNVDQKNNANAHRTGCVSELQDNSDREKEVDSFATHKPVYQHVTYSLESTSVFQHENSTIQVSERTSVCDMKSSTQGDAFPENRLKHQEGASSEVKSININQIESTTDQGTAHIMELQDRKQERETLAKPKPQETPLEGSGSACIVQTESDKPQGVEYGLKLQHSTNGEMVRGTFPESMKMSEEGASEMESIAKEQTESNTAQGTAHILELQDRKQETETLPKPKPQETPSESTCVIQAESDKPQGVVCGLKLQCGTDSEKKRELCTEDRNKSKSQGVVSNEVKPAIKKSKSETKEKVVKGRLNVENRTLSAEDAREKRMKYKEKHARIQVLTLGDSLEAYLPSLKTLISERKYRHCDLICKLDKLKSCAPTDATYCKCIFLIDLDEQTGKPVLGIFADGKVRKDWEGRKLYHTSILEAAKVLEKLISASEWEVGRGNKGFWRKVHICCNKFGELVLWLLVQSTEEKAKEVIRKLKSLFTEFFKKGEGKQCRIASVYAQIIFTSASASSDRRISSLTELIIGSEQYEDYILGFKLRMIPRIPTIWGMEKSCMVCEVVKDLVALDDHTTVIIIGITDCGLLALTLAKEAGEVICVDKVPIIEDVKQNVRLNNLESKCKFYAGFATEEVRKITPKYKKVHAVIMVPTVAKIMAFKERKNLSCVRSIIIFLESSNITSAPLMALGDTERGMSFFPSRIIPFDTHPDDKEYMMAIRTEQVEVHHKSSSRRSSGSSRSEGHREASDRTRRRRDSGEERRERNRMLPDAREVIVARRYNKEKEQLMSNSRFKANDHPNLVIEVKKPNVYNNEQRRYVKERTKEADEYRYKVVEEGGLCARTKQKVQEVLTDSLRRRLPSLDENTVEKLKDVIAEAIVGAGLVDSSHQRRESPLTPPEDVDHMTEHYLKCFQSNDIGQCYSSHISHFEGGLRRNEVTECSYINGSFQRQNTEVSCDRNSSGRISHNFPCIGREAVQQREPFPYGRSVHIDSCETFGKEDLEVGRDRTSATRTNDGYPNIGRETVGKRELLLDGRSIHVDTRETFHRQSIGDSCESVSATRTSHDYPHIGRETLRKRELLPDGRSVQVDTCETFVGINNYCDQQTTERSDSHSEIEGRSVRKRALEIDYNTNEYSEKRRRPQDHSSYKDGFASSYNNNSSSSEVNPYYNTQQRLNTFSQYVASEDTNRRSTEAHSFVTEQDKDSRNITNPVSEIPCSAQDFRHTAEKHSMLPQVSFSLFPTGSGPRPSFQHMYRHLAPESTFSNAVHPVPPVQGNMDVPQLPNIDFRRPPPYRPFMPPC